jgi:hypothetical protein
MVGYVLPDMSTHGWRSVGLAAATLVGLTLAAAGTGPRAGAGPTTTVAATTTLAAATSTAPPTTAATPTTTTAVVPPLPEPEDAESDPVRTLVPRIVAYAERLESESERQTAVATALGEGSNTVAVEAAPAMLCSIVPVASPLMASGRWERNGDEFATDELTRRDAPGYGDCVAAGDDELFDDGVYQYLAVGPTGATSGAGTVVVGARSVAVWLLNDGTEPVCLVQASPREADFYESFQPDSELLPGEALAISVASVESDVRVYGCPPDDVLRSFDLSPQFGVYVDLLGGEEPDASTPAAPSGSVTSTTPRPTTTG